VEQTKWIGTSGKQELINSSWMDKIEVMNNKSWQSLVLLPNYWYRCGNQVAIMEQVDENLNKTFCNLILHWDKGNLITIEELQSTFVILYVSRTEWESSWMFWSWRKGFK
jgi:hypothetical protein